MDFEQMGLKPQILQALAEIGFESPTQIQRQTIPLILNGADVIGRSNTGTGKTAAFALPCVQLCVHNEWPESSVLILCPTRELAVQICGEIRKFSKYCHGVSTAAVYGGQPMDGQIRQLKTAKIVVGTPGRIMDHLRRKTLKLENLKTVILDEADEMLNMGFHDDIAAILEFAPKERQTLLFSATMPPPILKLTQDFQKAPQMVAADLGKKTADNIEQSYYSVPQAGKFDAVKLLLEYHKPKRTLIFVNTKKMADELSSRLNSDGFYSFAIHGDLKQAQRNTVMQEFKAGRAKILVATDVAARGIDIDDVEAVINYDIPKENEYYVHRIGRTGRAGRTGASFTLAANKNQFERIRELEEFLKIKIEERPLPTVEDICSNNKDLLEAELIRLCSESRGDEYLGIIEGLKNKGFTPERIAAALCTRLTEKNKRLSALKNVAATGRKADKKVWVSVNIGSSERIAPNFIVAAITEATDLTRADIGKINIYTDHTEIELSGNSAGEVIRLMKHARIKQKPVTFNYLSAEKSRKEKEKRFSAAAKIKKSAEKGKKRKIRKSRSKVR